MDEQRRAELVVAAGRCRRGGSRTSSAGPAAPSTTAGDGRGGSARRAPSMLPRPCGEVRRRRSQQDHGRVDRPGGERRRHARGSSVRLTARAHRRTRPQRRHRRAARSAVQRTSARAASSERGRRQQRADHAVVAGRTPCHGRRPSTGSPLAIGSAPMPWPAVGGRAHDVGPVRGKPLDVPGTVRRHADGSRSRPS